MTVRFLYEDSKICEREGGLRARRYVEIFLIACFTKVFGARCTLAVHSSTRSFGFRRLENQRDSVPFTVFRQSIRTSFRTFFSVAFADEIS